jgi:glycosyltransferase involved in cell wall biosynthesis
MTQGSLSREKGETVLAKGPEARVISGDKFFSLVLPFYNEEANVDRVLSGLENALNKENIEAYEIVAVDNGSRDRTGELLRQKAGANPRIRIVTVYPNRGKGWGILQGLAEAQGDWVGFCDADGQIAPEDVVAVWRKAAAEDLDLCKVNRVVRQDGFERRVISWFFNTLCRVLFGVKDRDVNGTPKLLKRGVLPKLAIGSRDWFIDCEIMIKAARLALKTGGVDVRFLARPAGSSNVNYRTVLEFLKNMLVYRLKGRR